MNGFIDPIYLPPNASAEDIVSEQFLRPVRSQGLAGEFAIIELRYLHVPFTDAESRPLAILTRTDLGYQIVVATFSKVGDYWNVKVYSGGDAE